MRIQKKKQLDESPDATAPKGVSTWPMWLVLLDVCSLNAALGCSAQAPAPGWHLAGQRSIVGGAVPLLTHLLPADAAHLGAQGFDAASPLHSDFTPNSVDAIWSVTTC